METYTLKKAIGGHWYEKTYETAEKAGMAFNWYWTVAQSRALPYRIELWKGDKFISGAECGDWKAEFK